MAIGSEQNIDSLRMPFFCRFLTKNNASRSCQAYCLRFADFSGPPTDFPMAHGHATVAYPQDLHCIALLGPSCTALSSVVQE